MHQVTFVIHEISNATEEYVASEIRRTIIEPIRRDDPDYPTKFKITLSIEELDTYINFRQESSYVLINKVAYIMRELEKRAEAMQDEWMSGTG